jgi:general secretion pathway protein G
MKPIVLKHRYSLIEILIVCGILLILAGIGISVFSLVNRKMQDSRCQAMIAKMSIALENYKAKTGYYIQQPSSSSSSPSPFFIDQYKITGQECSLNDFIDIPSGELAAGTGRGFWKDPWGNNFLYKCPGTHNPMSFDLYSFGSDKASTTTAQQADDITNWKQ